MDAWVQDLEMKRDDHANGYNEGTEQRTGIPCIAEAKLTTGAGFIDKAVLIETMRSIGFLTLQE